MYKGKKNIIILISIINYFFCPVIKCESSVYVVSSLQRIFPDQVNVTGDTVANVFCAKEEAESFQIVVYNPSEKILPDIDLKSSAWTYLEGDSANFPSLRMFREHYVRIKTPSYRSKDTSHNLYPDALIPFLNPYTEKRIVAATYLAPGINISPGKNQAYWIDIDVGKDVKAGRYRNEITVLLLGKPIATIPINLTVWDITLPQVSKLKTYFGRMPNISKYHGTVKGSWKYVTIETRYRNMLRNHHANLTFQEYPKINNQTGEVIFTNQFATTLKRFSEDMNPHITYIRTLFAKEPIKRIRYLSSWNNFIDKNPWIPEPIIFIDEPSTREDYLLITEYGKALKEFAPHITLLVTEQIRPQKPSYPSLEGIVDIWVPKWFLANPSEIKRRQQAGDTVWSYQALSQPEVPVWLIDFPILNYRIPAWFSWSLDLKGILYWQTMSWGWKGTKIDPWINCQTYSSGGKVWNGEGSLIYPGADAGIEGPVASMRLKVFRDGVEDYNYFSILRELAGKHEADKIVKTVASNFKVYSKDPAEYIKARRLIAENILENRK